MYDDTHDFSKYLSIYWRLAIETMASLNENYICRIITMTISTLAFKQDGQKVGHNTVYDVNITAISPYRSDH